MREHRSSEGGFTLVELMVVVLIIAILMAVAIPTYLGAQRAARDRAVQSDLRNALTAAKTIAADSSPARFLVDGLDLTPAGLHAAEPSQVFDVVANADTDVTGVAVALNGVRITLLKQSAASRWFGISADTTGRITYCEGAAPGDCDDGAVDAFVATSW